MILALESAVAGGSIALISDDREISSWEGGTEVSRAEDLLPAIDQLLNANKISRSVITMIAVSAGPGSFTGIRIGLATAIGLSRGLDIPLSTVSVMSAMAAGVRTSRVMTAIPMGRSSICIQSFVDGIQETVPSTVSEDDFQTLVGSSEDPLVVHSALTSLCLSKPDVIDAGTNLAAAVGRYSQRHGVQAEAPIFVSKSF